VDRPIAAESSPDPSADELGIATRNAGLAATGMPGSSPATGKE
jgi:hypothetical protein